MSASRLLVMPKLGLTMTEGAVAEWTVAPGARFAAGDTLFVVESDKAAVEFDAPTDGVLHQILVPVGTTVPVGTESGSWRLRQRSTRRSRYSWNVRRLTRPVRPSSRARSAMTLT